MSVLFQKDGDNHGYFQEVCNTLEDLICLYDSPFQHELTDFLFDVIFDIDANVKDFKPGEIYIPATYFNFVGSFRSLYGLFGYGDVLEDNHQVPSIE